VAFTSLATYSRNISENDNCNDNDRNYWGDRKERGGLAQRVICRICGRGTGKSGINGGCVNGAGNVVEDKDSDDQCH